MDSERWQRLVELYHAALLRKDSDRAAYLAGACAGDETLRREVELLLAQPSSASGSLDLPAGIPGAEAVGGVEASVLTGRRLGVYQVQARIGVGGMDI